MSDNVMGSWVFLVCRGNEAESKKDVRKSFRFWSVYFYNPFGHRVDVFYGMIFLCNVAEVFFWGDFEHVGVSWGIGGWSFNNFKLFDFIY